MSRKVIALTLTAVAFIILAALAYKPIRSEIKYAYRKFQGGYSVDDRVKQYEEIVAIRLKGSFEKAGVPYPPAQVAYVAFKDSRQLEVYARSVDSESWKFIRSYPIKKASGNLGPKLKEGDRQVPEGIYRSEFLNANSRFHLSIRINYPNEFDRKMAAKDGRTQLGGDIMVHGGASSIGCLAMGDSAAEDLFILTALTKKKAAQILISPTDFRTNLDYALPNEPVWLGNLYAELGVALEQFSFERTHSPKPAL
jgi:hypothetical protein